MGHLRGDRSRIIDVAEDVSTPFTGAWVDARWHKNHTFQVQEDGAVTAADVEIQTRSGNLGDGVTVLGNTDTTGLTVPAAGDSMLSISNESYHEVRAVVNSITGTSGRLYVIYTAN